MICSTLSRLLLIACFLAQGTGQSGIVRHRL